MRRTSFPIAARVSGVVARSVPVSAARSGMMFGAVPDWIDPTVTTAAAAGSMRRATMVWRAVISAAAPTMGSADSCGRAP